MNELKPCPYRHAHDDGQILCGRIQSGDRAVSPNICRACPVAAINCAHLRATLNHDARPPITVRWGNGKTQIWESDAPSITLKHAACAAKVVPIHSSRECAGCTLRQPLATAGTIPTAEIAPVAKRASRRTAPAQQPVVVAQATPAPQIVAPPPVAAQTLAEPQASAAPPTPDARSHVVHQKIIQLQEWLKQNRAPTASRENGEEKPAETARVAVGDSHALPVKRVERRVGWTD